MKSVDAPRILIIAGPNGAGKTTFATEFLTREANCLAFVNADLIAAGMAPFAPATAAIRAGRLMIEEISAHVSHKESFAFETTLAGLYYAQQIPLWRKTGFRVELFFLSLPSPELAITRVATRVRHGGHDIPEAIIRRRFSSGLANFHGVYRGLVDAWTLLDSAGSEPVLVDWGENDESKTD